MQEDAILECEYSVKFDDINSNLEMTNVALLKYLEEPGGLQTKKIFGGMITPKGVWILLNWRVKKLKELYWSDNFKIKTWPAKHIPPFSIRNYEVYNDKNELTAIVSTKWVLIDSTTKRIVRDIEDVINKYTLYNKMLFEDDFPKLKEPDDLVFTYKHVIQRRDIDINKHVNNVKYLEIAYEALPQEVYDKYNFKNIDVTYKHSALFGEEMKVGFVKQIVDNVEQYIIVIKSNDKVNAIIRLS